MRLADYLFRWTGDVQYADYIERNLYNGILAQQHPGTGMISYFLPLHPGARKHWGSETNDFWCCHGTLVQAHTLHDAYVYYADADGLTLCQYIPTDLTWTHDGRTVRLRQTTEREEGVAQSFVQNGVQTVGDTVAVRRPRRRVMTVSVTCDGPVEFALRIRLPWWLADPARITVDGQAESVESGPSSFHTVPRTWSENTVRIEHPRTLTACPIPDAPDMVAFMDGPVVLAGLCDEERTLVGDRERPESLLAPANERQWAQWLDNWRTVNQACRTDFRPLHEITDERYTVYFPIRPA